MSELNWTVAPDGWQAERTVNGNIVCLSVRPVEGLGDGWIITYKGFKIAWGVGDCAEDAKHEAGEVLKELRLEERE